MIRILILLTTLIAGLIFGPEISANKGYLLVSVDSYTTYEMTLVNAVFLIIAVYLLLLLVEWLLRKLLSMSKLTRGWLGKRKNKTAQKNALKGMLALFEGESKQAQKLLSKAADRTDAPVLTYIAAAKAAHVNKQYDQRDELINSAKECQFGKNLAVGLTWAKLQVDAGQYENALASLREVSIAYPNNNQVSILFLDIYPKVEEWKRYLNVLAQQRKNLDIKESEFSELQLNGYRGYFAQLSAESGEALTLWWEKQCPRWMRKEVIYQQAILDAFIEKGHDQHAETFLITRLNKQFSLLLLPYLQKVTLTDYYPLIAFLEKKLKKESQKGFIHQALAYLMLKERKVGKAIIHLQSSIESVPNVKDYALLASLLEKDGRAGEAKVVYQNGLEFAAK